MYGLSTYYCKFTSDLMAILFQLRQSLSVTLSSLYNSNLKGLKIQCSWYRVALRVIIDYTPGAEYVATFMPNLTVAVWDILRTPSQVKGTRVWFKFAAITITYSHIILCPVFLVEQFEKRDLKINLI